MSIIKRSDLNKNLPTPNIACGTHAARVRQRLPDFAKSDDIISANKFYKMKSASIYKMPEGYLIYGLAATVNGVSIASEPFIYILQDEANAGAITHAIKASLCHDDSQKVPFPKNWKEFNQSILKKTGLKSFKILENPKTKLISINEDSGTISFLPTRPAKKSGKGHLFMSEDEAIIVSATASNEEMVAAYELAVSKCG